MARLSLLVLSALAVIVSAQNYGEWVGAMDQVQPESCRCNTAKAPGISFLATTARECGDSCFDPTTQNCLIGNAEASTTEAKNSGQMVCGQNEKRCGSPNYCQTRTGVAGTVYTGITAGYSEWCYNPNTARCYQAETPSNSHNENGDFICNLANPDIRCGFACGVKANGAQCWPSDDTGPKADTDIAGNTLLCGKDEFRCGSTCKSTVAAVAGTCWTGSETSGTNGASKASANIFCPKDTVRCHPGNKRINTECDPWSRISSDVYCYNNATGDQCIVDAVADTTGGAVVSGNTWVCPKDTFRCGYGCYGTNQKCVQANGDSATTGHFTTGRVIATTQKFCGWTAISSTEGCFDGSTVHKGTTDITSAATHICGASITDNDASDCSCTPVVRTCTTTPCPGCTVTDSASSMTFALTTLLIALIAFLF